CQGRDVGWISPVHVEIVNRRYRVLLEVGQQGHQAAATSLSARRVARPRNGHRVVRNVGWLAVVLGVGVVRQELVSGFMVDGSAGNLLEIVGALNPRRRRANLLHGRNQERDENSDDGNDDQQLDQREPRSSSHFCPPVWAFFLV